jgi:hypothetical protein
MKRRSTYTLTSPNFETLLNILLILYTLCGGTNKLQNTKCTQNMQGNQCSQHGHSRSLGKVNAKGENTMHSSCALVNWWAWQEVPCTRSLECYDDNYLFAILVAIWCWTHGFLATSEDGMMCLALLDGSTLNQHASFFVVTVKKNSYFYHVTTFWL